MFEYMELPATKATADAITNHLNISTTDNLEKALDVVFKRRHENKK